MSANSARLSIAWAVEAKADIRAIDRQIALDVLHCIDRFLVSRSGDVKKLKPPQSGLRLRCGEYRIFFESVGRIGIKVTGVDHRKQAYR